MIILHQFKPCWGIPNLSPFCVKVETYLRIAGLPYQAVVDLPAKGPKGKLPFIEDDGKIIADSRLIVEYLEETYGHKLDGHLTEEQSAASVAILRLLDESLYWYGAYARWQYSDANLHVTQDAVFAALPPLLQSVAAFFIRRSMIKKIVGQGTGRLLPDEIFHLAEIDLNALSVLLGDKPYLLGNKPSSIDAAAFGYLINILECPVESPIKDYALAKNNLCDYCRRMKTEFFPELTQN
ncbi:MAG: glutathione S-transferase family protein [Gammaproteobacteria bacterium]